MCVVVIGGRTQCPILIGPFIRVHLMPYALLRRPFNALFDAIALCSRWFCRRLKGRYVASQEDHAREVPQWVLGAAQLHRLRDMGQPR